MHHTTSDPKRRRIWFDVRNSPSWPVTNTDVHDTEMDNENEPRVTVSAQQPNEGLRTQPQMQAERVTLYDGVELVPLTKYVEDGDVTIPNLANEIARLHEELHSKRSTKWELSKLFSNIKHMKKRIVSLETKVDNQCFQPPRGLPERPSSDLAFNYASQLEHHGLRPDVNFAKRNCEARAPVSLSVKNRELSEELQRLRSTVRELKASVADLVAIEQSGTR